MSIWSCRRFEIVAAAALVIFHVLAQSTAVLADEIQAKKIWTQFRQSFPHSIQIVGLSAHDSKKERVLLISEPPPWFGGNDLDSYFAGLFGKSLRGISVERQPVGVDGWVNDLVVRFDGAANDDNWTNLKINELHRELYGSTYKAGALRLPIQLPKNGLLGPPNLAPRATELKKWLLDDDNELTSLTTGQPFQLRKLLTDGNPGTYFSKAVGLVVLLLPTNTPVDPYLFALRHFALDTDSILGAISSAGANRLAIVGRERTTSLLAMPPLRVETMLRLAATRQPELGQSYERTSPFAGKLLQGRDSGLDWAPIFLSNDLLNTEFGNLLNITDQMLKSWSEAGNIKYAHFKYPNPKTFPFPEGAAKYIGGSSLTYNWNTSGVGSVTDFQDYRIFTVLNTGALPVSYFPEGNADQSDIAKKASAAEETAYRYFAGLLDPNLARVVELSSLYQIFRSFPVKVNRDETVGHLKNSLSEDRKKRISRVLRSIADGTTVVDEKKLSSMVTRGVVDLGVPAEIVALVSIKDLPPEVNKKIAASAELLKLKNMIQEVETDTRDKALADIKALQQHLLRLKAIFSDDLYDTLAGSLADRSERAEGDFTNLQNLARSAKDTSDLIKKVRAMPQPGRDVALRLLVTAEFNEDRTISQKLAENIWWVGDVEGAKDKYVELAQSDPSFIRTPTVVLSVNTRQLSSVGGHNLYGKSTKLVPDATVPRGTVATSTQDGASVLRINPDDVSSGANIARAFAKNSKASPTDLQAALKSAIGPAEAPRPIQTALQMGPGEISRAERGVTSAQQGDLALGMSGWKVPADNGATLRAVQRSAGKYHVEIEKDGTSYILHRLVPQPPGSVRVLSPAEFPAIFKAVAEQVANSNVAGRGLVVRGTNLSSQEINGLTQTLASGGGGGGRRFIGRTEFGTPKDDRPWFAWLYARKGNTRYARKTRQAVASENENFTVIELLGKAENSQLKLTEVLDWKAARIDQLESVLVKSGEFRGLQQESWELTIPVASRANPAKARILAFFKKALNQDEKASVSKIISDSIAENAKEPLKAIDGFAELKADILKLSKTKPEALRFHLLDGSDDITIARGGNFRSISGG
jgi:hypothetical protein